MSNWVNDYAAWLFRNRWLVLLAVVLATAAGIAGLQHAHFKGDYRIFFGDDNPQLMAHDALERTYTKADTIFFVLQPKEGQVFEQEPIEAVKFVSERAWYLERAIRVDSISEYQHMRSEMDDLVVDKLIEDPSALGPDGAAYMRSVALSEPFLKDKMVSGDARTTGVQVTLQLPDEAGQIVPTIAEDARAIKAETEAAFPDLRVELTGTVMLNNSFIEAAQTDMATLYPLMMLFLALTLTWFLRSFRAALLFAAIVGGAVLVGFVLPLWADLALVALVFALWFWRWGAEATAAMIVTILSAVFAYGVISWLGIPVTSPSTSGFVMILTIAVADSIHVMVSMFAQMREGKAKREAIAESLRINMQPVFLTSLTTVIGFLSLNFSDAPPINDVGNIAAIGTAWAFFLSVSLLPVLLDIFPIREKRQDSNQTQLLLRIVEFVIPRRRVIVALTLILVTGLALMVPRLGINDKFVEFFSENMDFRTASDFSLENLTGIYILEFSVGADGPGGVSDPAYLQRLDEFVTWIEGYPVYEPTGQGVAHVNAFTHVMKRLNRVMHGDDPAHYKIPEDRELAAQYLLLYEMSLPEGQDLNYQINVDKSSSRVTVTMGDVSSSYMRQFGEDASAWLRDNQPAYMGSEPSGVALIFSYLTERNVVSMAWGTGIAFILISVTLLIALRSVKMGVISLLPNIIPAVVVFGIWSIIYGEVGMYAAMVTATALGLIVDFTVHFLSKYLRARREQGLSAEDGVRYAMATVGNALWITAFVLIAGFSALTLSDFMINSLMGLLVAMIIAVALVSDFLFLPALLLLVDGKKEKSSNESSGNTAQQPA
ncbi:MAG: MMPL family transporter [Alphaproteobacteria bacterium]